MISNHPYSRYALALIMQEEDITAAEDISHKLLIRFIKDGLNHFRLRPRRDNGDDDKVRFEYVKESYLTRHPKYIGAHCNEGFFLAPNILSSDRQAGKGWNGLLKISKALEAKIELHKQAEAKMAIMPMAGKFNNGRMNQTYPKLSFFEACLCAITTSTPYKPALHNREKSTRGKGKNYVSAAIIPDLSLEDLKRFIEVFREMQRTQTSDLMIGRYNAEQKPNPYSHPKLSNGNFPHAPWRPELASAALLGAIGAFAKEAEYPHSNIEEVLEKLKNAPMYIVSYGKAQVVTYGHYVVDLAKNDRLNTIINALHWVRGMLYVSSDSDKMKERKLRDQKFDVFVLFASRFLQLFDNHTFKDFLSLRGEYPRQLTTLFTTFYRRVMKINEPLVKSATALGRWLNRVAFFAACAELEIDSKNKEAVRARGVDVSKLKAKTLVELESAAFSAKSATALVSQVITRAGRISGQDAPPEASPFIEAVTSGLLGETEKESLENAKNMIVVFSRIRGSAQPITPIDVEEEGKEELEDEESSLSEAEQE